MCNGNKREVICKFQLRNVANNTVTHERSKCSRHGSSVSRLNIFSERELTFTFAICCRPVHVRYMLSPVRLSSVCRLSVTLVHPTQAVVIFGNNSTAFGTLAIH